MACFLIFVKHDISFQIETANNAAQIGIAA